MKKMLALALVVVALDGCSVSKDVTREAKALEKGFNLIRRSTVPAPLARREKESDVEFAARVAQRDAALEKLEEDEADGLHALTEAPAHE